MPSSTIATMREHRVRQLLAQNVHPLVVMEILGHSQISTTIDTYGSVMQSVEKEAAALMDEILGDTG